MSHPLILPMLIQMSLALAIVLIMAPRRLLAIKKAGGVAALRKAGGFSTSLNNMSDNFKHQFEVPVIFYAISLLLIATNTVHEMVVVAAWVFVICRILHTLVQCTSNIIFPYRFGLFLISVIAVVTMVAFGYGSLLGTNLAG